ncbi:reverse transcriptase family protein [Vibrio fluvialis]|uniref:reverse transcriptase family protein n=1 Tax=Vibrio fluvialis TaxID=676 RepID=UPI0028E054FC|nr:reverse transcriptase family protein [Vibrio fluvialis]MDT8867100.1 reverse transcriptase family protein [Vibrio fluvialis]MDT8874779.1 reverse transcriptase family protein [Vibrio fluvialis]
MNNTLKEWKRFFEDRGIEPRIISEYLKYIDKLESGGYPVIFEVEHLSKLIGIRYEDLNKMIFGSGSFYRTFKIKKRSGGKREISAPYPSLALCQSWIKENILELDKSHFCSHSYARKRSIVTNAKIHVNCNSVLKLDIRDFFPSIKINWVINYFFSLGYSENVAFGLASLCCLSDSLPQGARTSPDLSNLLLKSLDKRLYRLSSKFSFKYTRYADDITFSGDDIPVVFIKYVKDILVNYGFELNENKIRLIKGEKQKIVTGLDISSNDIRLPRKTRRDLKRQVYYIRKYGLLSHVSKQKIKDPNYIQSLLGKLAFWSYVEKNNNEAKEMYEYIKSLNRNG